MKKWISVLLVLALLAGAVAVPAALASGTDNNRGKATSATVVGGWLRLRDTPSFDGVILGSYFTGTKVTLLGSTGSWYHVQVSDGMKGYMYSAYLRLDYDSPVGVGVENLVATVVSANGLDVRLRSGPSTAYGVIGLYPVGTSATILVSGKNWHYIRIGRQTGYMMAKYLKTAGGTDELIVPAGYTAYITSENGYGVKLRSGAGTQYSVIGIYSVGTQVSVLRHGAVWDYVRIGSRIGYMMNRYLTTVSLAVTGVSLNTTTAVYGKDSTTLTATVTPAGATVTYRWTNNEGTLLSTESTYTVKASDVGKKVRVKVTGTGSYTGSATSQYARVTAAQDNSITSVTIDGKPAVGSVLTALVQPGGATVTYMWIRDDGHVVSLEKTYTPVALDAGHAFYVTVTGTGAYTGNATSGYTAIVAAAGPTVSPTDTPAPPMTLVLATRTDLD